MTAEEKKEINNILETLENRIARLEQFVELQAYKIEHQKKALMALKMAKTHQQQSHVAN